MTHPNRIEPGPGQESVWDYPRPPRVEETDKHVQVVFNEVVIADTHRAKRVLETSHPPVYYIPIEDVIRDILVPRFTKTLCEFKGEAYYYGLFMDDEAQVASAAWYYPSPNPGYETLKMHLAFYPDYVDACYVDGELVTSQPGKFYGGWVTKDIVGPFKGEPGTETW
ncbi:MAG: DUF427 domain-containing protein [Chloroflexi bacterium]|nr:DUF427 domain-containing protein [Chloroflexota bacterium]